MEWSREQLIVHQRNFDKFREMYIKGKTNTISLTDIVGCKKRCITLIEQVQMPSITNNLELLTAEMMPRFPGSYFQEIPHFTINCHRYLNPDGLPEDINSRGLEEQKRLVITPEELDAYDRILRENIEQEPLFRIEIKGVSFGADGLVAQIWYDNQRLQDFNDSLGERVRTEVPSMDFQWGLVKNKIPIRVINLIRFIGNEDPTEVIRYTDANRDREFGTFDMDRASLVFSDHYLQRRNTIMLGKYNFSK